jgi:hypothetical protein
MHDFMTINVPPSKLMDSIEQNLNGTRKFRDLPQMNSRDSNLKPRSKLRILNSGHRINYGGSHLDETPRVHRISLKDALQTII